MALRDIVCVKTGDPVPILSQLFGIALLNIARLEVFCFGNEANCVMAAFKLWHRVD